MFAYRLCAALILGSAVASCDAAAPPVAGPPLSPPGPGYKAVLIAGDPTLPVFDNAVAGVYARLRERSGSRAGDIQRLSAAPAVAEQPGVMPATLANVLQAVATMRPGPGQGCFVYATSHGGQNAGLSLRLTGEFLTPEALDSALLQSCGNAPTVVIVSSCYSGSFARPPMTRPNRIVLTAARPDRTSFGCRAGRVFTVYDHCLLDAFDTSSAWQTLYDFTKSCVGAEERREHVTPSEPQAWFGAAAADTPLPIESAHS